MSDIKFKAVMTKFQPIIKKEAVIVSFQLKVTEDSSIRTFPQQFRGQIDLMSLFASNATQDVWLKASIPLADYRMKYEMTFDQYVFDARLDHIDTTRKEAKDGTWSTEYNLSFIKELDKDLDTNLSSLLKYKAIDPETGKKVTVQFDTTLVEKN
jgi:hypothetical protein